MSTERDASVLSAAVIGGSLVGGLVCGGWILGGQIKAIRLADRYVTVKGLVERTVKSDTAIWPISFKEAGNDLPAVFTKSEADKTAIMNFFAQQGIVPAEITLGQIQVTDKQANEYGGQQTGSRYIVQQTITAQSSDVDKIARAGTKTADLVRAGIAIGGNGQGISYKFTGLNALKPDMITEATRNARASADRFAADSGSTVGSIRSANQGIFSISGLNQGSDTAQPDEAPAGDSGDSSIMKRVRVVATVEYYLVK